MDQTTDARNRAWRTLLQGLLIDVTAALVVVLAPALASVEWTAAYWQALGLLLAKSVLQALVAFAARHVAPPPQA